MAERGAPRREPRRPPARRERGAVLVEAAIITPLLLLLVFGIVEFGLLLRSELGASNASREAARAGASLTAKPGFDQVVLERARSSLADFSDDRIAKIVVFEAGPDGRPTSGVDLTALAAGSSCGARCIAWYPGEAAPIGTWDPADHEGCIPTEAATDVRTRLGVYVELVHDPITPVIDEGSPLGSPDDTTIVRLEPTEDADECPTPVT